MGFLAFVKTRQRAKEAQLFNVKPRGADNDWSKDYRKTFGNILNDVGFKAGQRLEPDQLKYIDKYWGQPRNRRSLKV